MSIIAVVGASGRTGSAVTEALTRAGHDVLAVSRSAPAGAQRSRADAAGAQRTAAGAAGAVEHRATDVLDPAAVKAGLAGADAVVVTLGISENPLTVRLRGAQGTSSAVRSVGTRHVVQAMESHSIRRLVVLSSYGVGDSASGLSFQMKLIIGGLLRPQFRDHEAQEGIVRASGLDWTLARPVNLLDSADAGRRPVITDPHMRAVSMSVGREQVAAKLADWATTPAAVGKTVALSS